LQAIFENTHYFTILHERCARGAEFFPFFGMYARLVSRNAGGDMTHMTQREATDWFGDMAAGFMDGPENDLRMPDSREPAFDRPLFGIAAGDDPLWEAFRDEHVGAFHWTPAQAFALAFPGEKAAADELSVVCWILPQTEATLRDHRACGTLPAERWVRSRMLGEIYVNDGLRRHMCLALERLGVRAAAPLLLPQWSGMDSERFGYASTWSERHAAYAAGLGTFGLCDGLITAVGKAMRVGSIVVHLRLPPTPRPYRDHREYCLYFNSGVCGACIRRCPVKALSPDGHDKRKCRDFLQETVTPYVKKQWDIDGYGCGLCQVRVPCERGIPPRPKTRRSPEFPASRSSPPDDANR
jgi:ferredoxin